MTQEIGYQNQASSDRASLAKGSATCHFYLHKSATGQQLQLIIFRKSPSMQKYLWGKTLQTCNKWATQLQPQLTDPLAKAEKNSCIKVHLYCHAAGDWGPTKIGSICTQCRGGEKSLIDKDLYRTGSEAEPEILELRISQARKHDKQDILSPQYERVTKEQVLTNLSDIERNRHKITEKSITYQAATIQFYHD